ncbi:MAG: TlyA family RNA methyltransferase [Clostridiales bacterium]|nr:TlyA family RNA methyltransferase [Clostridiales bacterium]
MKKTRLDQLVYDRGLTESRERAKTSVMAGLVYVNGQKADKPGAAVSEDALIELRGKALPYVSRGGLKLEKALKEFNFKPEGLICIDCGASTGGFTDVLLKNGAAKVYAVDVGYGQLAWSLRTDSRVISMERTNIRHVSPDMLDEAPQLAVMDLSFISLKLVLPVVRELLTDEGNLICLIKPQFEAGKERVGKKGVVRDFAVHLEVLSAFMDYAPKFGYTVLGLSFSPIKGPEGNIEYLAHLRKGSFIGPEINIEQVVEASKNELGGSL